MDKQNQEDLFPCRSMKLASILDLFGSKVVGMTKLDNSRCVWLFLKDEKFREAFAAFRDDEACGFGAKAIVEHFLDFREAAITENSMTSRSYQTDTSKEVERENIRMPLPA